jgi:hypothetical protein
MVVSFLNIGGHKLSDLKNLESRLRQRQIKVSCVEYMTSRVICVQYMTSRIIWLHYMLCHVIAVVPLLSINELGAPLGVFVAKS